MSTAITSVQATALFTGTFLTGAMMSLSFVTVPAILDTATETAQLQKSWECLFYRGHRVLPAMAVGTCLLHGYTALSNSAQPLRPWGLFALAGIATVSIAPFTWTVMAATNAELFRLGALPLHGPAKGGRVRELVIRWAWLHLARSLLPLVGVVIGAMATF